MSVSYPDFIYIVNKCKQKMEKTYLKYGNSWIRFNGLKFWKERLDGELDEIWKAETFKEYQSEIRDTINILSMMHDRYDDWLFSDEFRKSLLTKNDKGEDV